MPLILPDGGPTLGLGETYYSGASMGDFTGYSVEAIENTNRGLSFLESVASGILNEQYGYFSVHLLFHTGGANNWAVSEVETATSTVLASKHTGLYTDISASNAYVQEAALTWRWDAANKYMIIDSPLQLQVQNTKTTPVVYNYVAMVSSAGSVSPTSFAGSLDRGRVVCIIAEDGNITLNPGEMSKQYGIKPTASWLSSYP